MIFLNDKQSRYLGNVHCHSVRSDGESTVEELVNGYKNEGYNFLVISDHRRVYNKKIFNDSEFILIPGMEVDTWVHPNPKHQFFHFQTIGDFQHDHQIETEVFDNYKDSMKPYSKYSNYLRILNHPHWSRMYTEDIIKLKPKHMEIYNHASEVETACGFDLKTWDELLHRGLKVNGIAADDNHMLISSDNSVTDYYGGLIVVLSDELAQKDIIDNIESGNYYSKMGVNGPDFKKITIENDTIKVWSTNVEKIRFIAFNYHGDVLTTIDDKPLTYGEFKVSGHKVVRIELIDKENKMAWSNPIYFE